jgi:MOSC domain-containing protein YiiM
MREVRLPESDLPVESVSFLACLATILELAFEEVPLPSAGADAATGWGMSRWLGSLGLGLARIAEPAAFSWPGPWIARAGGRFVVMFGVPSGVVWDPAGGPAVESTTIEDGFIVAAADIALAMPPRRDAPAHAGTVEVLAVAVCAGEPAQLLPQVRALAGRGLEGDRHVTGQGTFPSGPPGSALTLIEAEVCESFDPPLEPSDHRRNVVTRGIDLNALVGHEFTIGEVPCRGMRLCEPCTVVQRYVGRPVLRALVHRGGLRADILRDGEIRIGDPVRAAVPRRARTPGGTAPGTSPKATPNPSTGTPGS